MNYIRSVFKFEDKLRLYAILLLAVSVLALSFVDSYQDRKNEDHHHHTHAAEHM